MTTDIVTTNGNAPARSDLLTQATPGDMLAQATAVANVLKDVIVKQNLISDIQGKKFVKVEGWNTMGCMLGILSREKKVEELEDGSFLAEVELYSMKTGSVVGTGSALCGKDEQRWGRADRYARRSMAITRATGKAYRLNFSWVMALAGYEVTPEEEHPQAPSNRPAAEIYMGTEDQNARLEKRLTQLKVDKSLWLDVQARLNGRPTTELFKAIEEAKTVEGAFQ